MTDLEFIQKAVERRREKLLTAARAVWQFAELPYAEIKSARLLADFLKSEGFTLTEGVAGIPTAFVASFANKEGGPVAGLLGEFDALDALSQQAALAEKFPVREGGPGHGCGHNLLGVGALAAALAVKDYLQKNDLAGTVRYYGCAAEEGAGAKQFMARAGMFSDLDFAFTWHPSTENRISARRSVAIMGANFSFRGRTAHAGASPHLGRSALDAAELMSVGVNYLREHMLEKARIHYAYSNTGGTAPNVVPDTATVKYEVRAPKVNQMKELFARVVKVAEGAALMTETQMSYEITMAFSDYFANDTLAQVANTCFAELSAPAWSAEDFALASAFQSSYDASTQAAIRESLALEYGANSPEAKLEVALDSAVRPYDARDNAYESGSTDVGDVAYAAPTLNAHVATAALGTVGHTWQMTAQSNSSIGDKGMLLAAKLLALSVVRTLQSPEIIFAAKAEYWAATGGVYICPLPDSVNPPVGKY